MKKPFASFLASLLASALALGAAAPPKPGAPRRAPKVHPQVEADQDCADCHGGDPKSPAQAWERSKHGLSLVKCLVCHGSTGKDFAARPGIRACRSCHADKLAAVGKGRPATCFACHDPHTLAPRTGVANPHAQ